MPEARPDDATPPESAKTKLPSTFLSGPDGVLSVESRDPEKGLLTFRRW